jgi:hypothetical protein
MKSVSRKNKEWRRRKGIKALLKRNRDKNGIINVKFDNIQPLTKNERKTMYKWKLRDLGLFNKKITIRARKDAIALLDRKLKENT